MSRRTTLKEHPIRKTFYCVINQKQIQLGKDKDEAELKMRELLVEAKRDAMRAPTAPSNDWSKWTLNALRDYYVAAMEQGGQWKPASREIFITHTIGFFETYGDMRFQDYEGIDQMSADGLIPFLDKQKRRRDNEPSSESSRCTSFDRINVFFNWISGRKGKSKALVPHSPLRFVENKYHITTRRDNAPTDVEFNTIILKACGTENDLRFFLRVVRDTGMRANEPMILCKRHCHLDEAHPYIRFEWNEYKNRTGKKEPLFRYPVDPEIIIALKVLILRYGDDPEAPILRRKKRPWTQNMLDKHIKIIQEVYPTFSTHLLKHLYDTEVYEEDPGRAPAITGTTGQTLERSYVKTKRDDAAKAAKAIFDKRRSMK
jgi:integrase